MSSWGYGEVYADLDCEPKKITVEGGRGWGGDGECYNTVLLSIDNAETLLKLTSRTARELADLLIMAADSMDDLLRGEGL